MCPGRRPASNPVVVCTPCCQPAALLTQPSVHFASSSVIFKAPRRSMQPRALSKGCSSSWPAPLHLKVQQTLCPACATNTSHAERSLLGPIAL